MQCNLEYTNNCFLCHSAISNEEKIVFLEYSQRTRPEEDHKDDQEAGTPLL